MTITIDPKSLEGKQRRALAWMMYGISARSGTDGYKKFKSEHPGEKEYRHSLREEASMRMVVEMVKEQQRGPD